MRIIFLPLLLFCINTSAQKVVTHTGTFDDGRYNNNGIATYTYYENPDTREYIKHGPFKYTFKGSGGYIGFNQTITGNFKNGLKNGTWIYTINLIDAHIDYDHSTYLGSNGAFDNNHNYSTGSITLQANYKDGIAHGKWKEVISYKQRPKFYIRNSYAWGPFGKQITTTIELNFNDGKYIGEVNINDGFYSSKITGKYDNSSYADATWVSASPSQSEEYVYKDRCYYQYLKRDSKGQIESGDFVKFEKEYEMVKKALSYSEDERIDNGYSLINKKSWATEIIKNYTNELLNNEYFLYKNIGGDLSYENGFAGGFQLNAEQKEYIPLLDIQQYMDAEKLVGEKNYIIALINYSQIQQDKIKPSEKKNLIQKIDEVNKLAEDQASNFINESKFYKDYYNNKFTSFKNSFDSAISMINLNLNIYTKYQSAGYQGAAQGGIYEKANYNSRFIKSLEWGTKFYARPILDNPYYYEYSSDGKKVAGYVFSESIIDSYDDMISKIISGMLQKEKEDYKKDSYYDLKVYRREILNSINTAAGKVAFILKIMAEEKINDINTRNIINNLEEFRKLGVFTDSQIKFIISSLEYRNFLIAKFHFLNGSKVEIEYPSKGKFSYYSLSRNEFLDKFEEQALKFAEAIRLLTN